MKLNLIVLAALLFVFCGCEEKTFEKIDTRPLVRVGVITNGVEFADALVVQGMIRAKNVSAIAARVPGTIDALLVEEGAVVKKDTPLFRVDQINLGNAVRAAKDDLAMAKARLAQATATDAKAKLDVERMTRLLKDGAVTKDMFEKADVGAKSAAAACDAAKATITKAETGLAVAEKNFADSEVKAPFDGIITKKLKNTGDFCGAGVKIFEMEDSSCYEVCLSLNAAHYGQVVVGKTELEVEGEGEEKKAGRESRWPADGQQAYITKGASPRCFDGKSCCRGLVVSYKSPSVNPMTRTFEVRAVVKKTEALAAGMLVDCRVVFARRKSAAVPATAVAERGGGDCIFVVRGGQAVRIPVEAGLSTDGWREILAPAISPSEPLIVEGQLLVNEGAEVRITEH